MKPKKRKNQSIFARQNYFTEMLLIIKEGGLKLFFRYHYLKLRQILGFKTFRIINGNICTTNEVVAIGKEYQFREGSHLERAIVESIKFKMFFVYIRVFLFEKNRRISCSHTLRPCGYMGMWRLWDKDHYNIEQWRKEQEEEDIDYDALDSIPVLEI